MTDSSLEYKSGPCSGLAGDSVHLWLCRSNEQIPRALVARYWALLNDAERNRHRCFRFEHLRLNYLLTRALLRTSLSKHVPTVAPEQWRFGERKFGKPYIKHPEGCELQFNLSHAGNWIVLAVRLHKALGIDIEPVPSDHDVVETVSRYFTRPEIDWLLQHDRAGRADAFIRLWVMKEAYVKATGTGLSASLDSFAIDFTAPDGVQVHEGSTLSNPPGQYWRTALLRLDRNYRIGLALVSAPDAPVNRLVLQPPMHTWQMPPTLRLVTANRIELQVGGQTIG